KPIAGSMARREPGLVLSITSDAAVEAYSGWGAYSITKAALDHMTRVFAAELGDSGVQFLSIDPGDMDTEMHAAALPDADPATLQKPEDPARHIIEIIRRAEEFSGGARLQASQMEVLR